MRLSTLAAIVALTLSGCGSSPYQAPDPFAAWGHRRVPPPGTGTLVAPGAASPYYQPSPTGTGVPPGGVRFNSGQSGAVITPSGYFGSGGSATLSPGSWKSASAADPAPSSTVTFGGQPPALAGGASPPFVPPAMGPVVGSGLAAPQRFTPSTNAIDISQLPRVPSSPNYQTSAGFTAPVTGHSTALRDSSIAMAGWNSPVPFAASPPLPGVSSPVGTPVVVQSGGYGYDPGYSWLKGKLEYSATAQRWKLRYIPRDASENRIDQYGGSAILADAARLSGFSPGEFVRAEGRVVGPAAGEHGFAPNYQLTRIERQAH